MDKSGSCDGEKTGRLERDLGSENGQDLDSPWVYIGRREGGQVSSDLLLCIPPYFIVHNLKSMSHIQKSKLLLYFILIIILKCKPFSIFLTSLLEYNCFTVLC